MSMRKFLKQVGVTSQREIEAFVRSHQHPAGTLPLKMTLTSPGSEFVHTVEGEIDLP